MENIFAIKILRVPADPPHSTWKEGGFIRFCFMG